MNILCLDQFGELGGAQRCLVDLIPAMSGRGWSVHLAVPHGPLAEQAAECNVTVDPIECGPYSSGRKTLADMARFAAETPRLAREIRTLVARYDADLIYVNGPRLLPAVALAARKVPRVFFHAHNRLRGPSRRLAGRSLATVRAAVVASCHFVAQSLVRYAGHRGVRVVYNGVRQVPLRDRVRNGEEFRIGTIGRIAPEKGQAEFLRAARILHGMAPQCRFLICGAPLFSNPEAMRYCAELEELAEDLPVEFAGWTEDVDGVLATLDLLVVPSAPFEATPRVILEAFAAGVPVLSFDSGGIPEIVEYGVTGFVADNRSPRGLAFGMRALLQEPHRLREAAEQARARASTTFTLERYRAQIIETIEAAMRD